MHPCISAVKVKINRTRYNENGFISLRVFKVHYDIEIRWYVILSGIPICQSSRLDTVLCRGQHRKFSKTEDKLAHYFHIFASMKYFVMHPQRAMCRMFTKYSRGNPCAIGISENSVG